MALTAAQQTALREAAQREGVDPEKLLAAAEQLAQASPPPASTQTAAPTAAPKTNADGRPVADRLLIGFLPFIRVRELRRLWLKLDESLPDDDLTCGAYQLKYGGTGAVPAGGGDPSGGGGG